MGATVYQNESWYFVWERLQLDYGVEYEPPAYYGVTTVWAQQTGAVVWQGNLAGTCGRVENSHSTYFYMHSQTRDGSWEQWSAQGNCLSGRLLKDWFGVLGY